MTIMIIIITIIIDVPTMTPASFRRAALETPTSMSESASYRQVRSVLRGGPAVGIFKSWELALDLIALPFTNQRSRNHEALGRRASLVVGPGTACWPRRTEVIARYRA